mmetsp:Transcript_42150/g.103710  ORF Transcript_42150/g.103710 Transcript_42150/m.103710 type:complete len:224 (-) Transcript_42150:252-923(-)
MRFLKSTRPPNISSVSFFASPEDTLAAAAVEAAEAAIENAAVDIVEERPFVFAVSPPPKADLTKSSSKAGPALAATEAAFSAMPVFTAPVAKFCINNDPLGAAKPANCACPPAPASSSAGCSTAPTPDSGWLIPGGAGNAATGAPPPKSPSTCWVQSSGSVTVGPAAAGPAAAKPRGSKSSSSSINDTCPAPPAGTTAPAPSDNPRMSSSPGPPGGGPPAGSS